MDALLVRCTSHFCWKDPVGGLVPPRPTRQGHTPARLPDCALRGSPATSPLDRQGQPRAQSPVRPRGVSRLGHPLAGIGHWSVPANTSDPLQPLVYGCNLKSYKLWLGLFKAGPAALNSAIWHAGRMLGVRPRSANCRPRDQLTGDELMQELCPTPGLAPMRRDEQNKITPSESD